MPANLIVALVLLVVEALRYHRAKNEQRSTYDDQPSDGDERQSA